MGVEVRLTRRALINKATVAAAAMLTGAGLTQSAESAQPANYGDLHRFLDGPSRERFNPGRASTELLSHLAVERPCDVRWIHRADSVPRLDRFFGSPELHLAEVDFRFDPKRGLYIGHDRGDRTDADIDFINERLLKSTVPKAIKYDCKDKESTLEVLRRVDPRHPIIINASIFGSPNFGMAIQDFVAAASSNPNAVVSIGRNLGVSRYTPEMLEQFIDVITQNPNMEFTLPIHIQELFVGQEPFEAVLGADSRVTLTVFRTQGFELTQNHVKLLKRMVSDEVRVRTYFDL